MKHVVMEMHYPGWIDKLEKDKDEIVSKERVRAKFEEMVEEAGLPLGKDVLYESHLSGDCREFLRLSLFVKYHSTYRIREGGCGLCSKKHWLASWCVLPGHMGEEREIAREVAEGFDRRHPELGILSLPPGWWQI